MPNRSEKFMFLNRLPVAAIVSDIANHQVVWLNDLALNHFGFETVPEGVTSFQLLELSEDELTWYLEVKEHLKVGRFQPIKNHKRCCFAIVLDCVEIEIDGEYFRLDTFNTKDYDELPLYGQYSYYFESTARRLDSLYKGVGKLEANIDDLLDLVLYVYAGDRAFAYEIDKDLCCTVDIYERCRKGFTGYNDKYKTLAIEEVSILYDRIEKGIGYTSVTEDNQNDFYRERMEKGMVLRTMAVPFTCRSGLKCFLCIDNPRRFWNWDSYLKFASYLLANDIHTEKIHGYLNASYLLNKSLLGSNHNQVKVYMLGGFEIQTSNGILRDGSFHSPQVCTLIALLLLNRKRMLSIYEISEAIWPDQIIDAPYNQVKGVVFRARKALEGICQKPLIEASEGTYCINSSLDIWLDTEEFERLCKKAANDALPAEQRLELYNQAFTLYRGGMLPFLEPGIWLLTLMSYYQILYSNMVNEYLTLLIRINDYTKAFAMASSAVSIEPSNLDVYYILMRALIKNKHYGLAKKYYQKISRIMATPQKEEFQKFWYNLTKDIKYEPET